MKAFGEFITRKRWWVLATWLVAAVVIVAFSPRLSSIETNDQSGFLPKEYESIKAMTVAKQISATSQNPTDVIVFQKKAGGALNAADTKAIGGIVAALAGAHIPHVLAVATSPQQLAPNGKVQLAQVVYKGNEADTSTMDAVKAIRTKLSALTAKSAVSAATTGGESISFDTQDTANRALKIVSIGTLLMVLILPALVFRSPLAGLLPLASVGLVYTVASSLIGLAGTVFGFKVDQQVSIIFTVVLYGIGTDYVLFLLFRYRERLRSGDHTREAVAFALGKAGQAIFAAALVVLTSFAALFFAKFGIFSNMAPGLVICVGLMMLAALTLIPALVAIIGDKVFWPSKSWKKGPQTPTVSKLIGGFISRRPVVAVGGVLVFLVILTSFMIGAKSDFSSFSQPQKGTPSAKGYDALISAFPGGILNPTDVYVRGTSQLSDAALAPLIDALKGTAGVANLMPTRFSPDKKTAVVSAVLKENPFSSKALTDIEVIRNNAHGVKIAGAQVFVGGATSLVADLKAVTNRDLKVLFPIAAAFIFIILAVLLRSLVAPILLLLCVGIGYYATIGATNLIFVRLGNNTGLISFIPIFIYIFVVAIGTDYNILTVTRLREEVRDGHKPRRAADLTVEHSSGTVASAGLILAATFGSLLLGGISFLNQMGTAVSVGVLLSAFVIAPFLIPGISVLVGYRIWWPGHRPKPDAVGALASDAGE
jgi:putative drug exporter of the RND superfamily